MTVKAFRKAVKATTMILVKGAGGIHHEVSKAEVLAGIATYAREGKVPARIGPAGAVRIG